MRVWFCVALCVAAAVAGAQEALFRPKAVTAKAEEVPLTVHPETGLATVWAVLNGVPCELLVDTGATHTTLDKAFLAKHLPTCTLQPISVQGETNVEAALAVFTVEALEVGGTTFKDFYGVAAPLGHLEGGLGKSVAGILGMNVLGEVPLRLSLKDKRLAWRPGQAVPEGAKALPVDRGFEDNSFHVRARAGEGEETFPVLLDSGANVTIMSPKAWPGAAEKASLETVDVNKGRARDFGKGKRGTLRLGDFALEVEPLLGTSLPPLVGADAMKGFDLYLDGKGKRAWAVAR